MSLSAGSRIGPYEIQAALGAGGMGEVYRARDTKLHRDVALKFLLPSVATDPDRLARFDREAQVLASLNHPEMPVRSYKQPVFSPDGTRMALAAEEQSDIWIHDLARGITSRLATTAPLPRSMETPHWSSDGTRLVWAAAGGRERDGKFRVVVAPSDGGGPEDRLAAFDSHLHITGWSADDRLIYFDITNSQDTTRQDILVYSFDDRRAKPFLQTPANEFGAVPSPDGRLIAYVSDEDGKYEIYLRGSDGNGRTQISRVGGLEPVWSNDGRELFFRALDGSLMAVSVNGAALVGAPRPLFSGSFASLGRTPIYAPSPDGKRFLIVQNAPQTRSPELEVTLNWAADLKSRAPAK